VNTKKMLALLVAGACGAPIIASAQDASPITIYGRLYPQFTVISSNGATATTGARNTLSGAPTGVEIVSHNELQASNSRLGFRGKENLGGGLEAFFAIESTIPVDAGGGTFATRDSFVGIRGDFGSVKLGIMDTVYKQYGDKLSFLGVSSGNFVSNSNVLSKGGFGTSSASSFHLRRANSVVYDSPTLGGFEFSVGYSPDELKTSTRNAAVISTGVNYGGGKGSPFFVALAYEKHNDLFGGSNNVPTALSNTANLNARSKDTAVRLTGSYTFFEKTTVEANFATMKYVETGGLVGRFNDYKHNAFSVSAEHNVDRWQFAASFVRANSGSCSLVGGAVCTTDGLQGTQASVGGRYNFSKRFSVFGMYAKVKNDFAARYNNLANGSPSSGSDLSHLALGLQHTF
jgi:predicted porin